MLRYAGPPIPPPTLLYHVTHASFVRQIIRWGLSPDKARGRPVVWLCDAQRLAWALRHVPESHRWNPDECVILAVTVPESFLSRRREGVYWTEHHLRPVWIRRDDGEHVLLGS